MLSLFEMRKRKIAPKRRTTYGIVFPTPNLLSKLDAHALSLLHKIRRIEAFENDTLIYRNGGSAKYIYMLLQGRAQLANSIQGVPLRIIRRNEVCGVVEVLSDIPYQGDLKTILPCICCVIARPDLVGFLRDHPAVCFRLTRLLSRDYQELTEEVRLLDI